MASALSKFFEGVTAKRLSAVEADPERSHQHEFNGVEGLMRLFGKRAYGEKESLRATFLYLEDDAEEAEKEEGMLTWYESRKKPRSEHRLYYQTSALFSEGDLIVFGKMRDGSVAVIYARQGSSMERKLIWLFSLSEQDIENVEFKDLKDEKEQLGFAEKMILEGLGFEAVAPATDLLQEMLKTFDGNLPETRVFSEYARIKAGRTDEFNNPDGALVSWVSKEEELFRAFEKHLVSDRLREGFGKNHDDVDQFISFSLSVHNRRKARMGNSFENHLKHLFLQHGLKFSHKAKTERKRTPDFLFPGIEEYLDSAFPVERLTLLGAKSTCKERWAQVLNEGERIPVKHLVTLEAGISEDQTDEMKSSRLQLVIPSGIHETYTPKQQSWLMSVSQFISLVKERQ